MKQQALNRAAALALATLALSACGSLSLDVLSLGGPKEQDTTRAPAGATAYQCDSGNRLFVRYLDQGAAAWVILPGREFRLNKIDSASGNSFGNGSDTLDTEGGTTTLREGGTVTYAGCKAVAG